MPIIDALIVLANGAAADLPSSAEGIAAALNVPVVDVQSGIPFFCTDSGFLYMWNGTAMVQIGATGFISPMLAAGDLIYEDPSLGAARLPIGTSGEVLTVVNGLPVWAATAQSTNFEANGSTLSSDSTINFEGDGTYIAASNPSAGNVKFALNYSALVSALETSFDAAFDAYGSAASALSAAGSFATSAIATETSRAESAEALLAPKASPTFTGTVSGITAAMVGADASGAAATAQSNAESFATAAVATETSRAEAAEALLAPLAGPSFTGTATIPTAAVTTLSGNPNFSGTPTFASGAGLGSGTFSGAATFSGNLIFTGSSTTTLGTATTSGNEILQNTAPTVTGSATSLALTQATVSGSNVVYAFASQSGAAGNAWVDASVTIAGFTNAGNNGTFIITASTTNSFTVANASGVNETHAATAISSTVVHSPALILAGTYGTGTNDASGTDSWTIQTGTTKIGTVNAAPTGPNPNSALIISHTGSTGIPYLVIPGYITAPVGNGIVLDVNNNGGSVEFTMQNGSYTEGYVAWGSGGAAPFGLQLGTSNQNYPIFVQGWTTTGTTYPCVAIGNANGVSLTAISGTQVGLEIGRNAGTGVTGTFTFAPVVGTANFQCVKIDPIINQLLNTSSPSSYSVTSNVATFVLPTMTQAFSNTGSVTIAGATGGNAFLNGTWTVSGTPTTTQLKLNITNANVSSTALSGVTASQQATGNYTALLVNPTETAVGGTGALLDLQVGGTSKFTVNNKGHIINGVADSQGSITSSSGTTVSYSYANQYNSTPTVVVTPTTNAGAFYLSSSTNTGFTITYANSGAQTFNYMVEGNPN